MGQYFLRIKDICQIELEAGKFFLWKYTFILLSFQKISCCHHFDFFTPGQILLEYATKDVF